MRNRSAVSSRTSKDAPVGGSMPPVLRQGTSAPNVVLTPVASGLLQRKCACGGTPDFDGECAACRARRLHRSGTGQPEPADAPPIVHEVLQGTGQPLDTATRAFMEPRFGYDFSQVRVHTDAKAAESARVVR